jgi:hypothetical protein
MTSGTLRRRHVVALARQRLGKEGNWLDRRAEGEGASEEAQEVYEDPGDYERYVLPVLRLMNVRQTSATVGINERTFRDIRAGRSTPRPTLRAALLELAGAQAAEWLGDQGLTPLDACAALISKGQLNISTRCDRA